MDEAARTTLLASQESDRQIFIQVLTGIVDRLAREAVKSEAQGQEQTVAAAEAP